MRMRKRTKNTRKTHTCRRLLEALEDRRVMATMLVSAAAPAVDGGDIAMLNTTGAFDAGGDNGHVWSNRPVHGQTFTTSPYSSSLLHSFTLQSFNSDNASNPANWTGRIGEISGNTFTPIASETSSNTISYAAGDFLTFEFDTPVSLAPDTVYGFDIDTSGSGFVSANNDDSNYTGGEGFSSGTNGTPDNANLLFRGLDRVFHVDLSANFAVDDTGFTTNEDTVLNVPDGATDLIANDLDGPVALTSNLVDFDATSANGAAVAVNADGSFSYDPSSSSVIQGLADGDTLTDTFTYNIAETPQAGLLAGSLTGNLTTAPNPGNLGLANGPQAALADGGSRDAEREAHWNAVKADGGAGPDDTTLIYTGEILLQPGDTHFLEQNDDKVLLTVDGVELLNDGDYDLATGGTFTNSTGSPAWFDFDLRLSNGGGGYGFSGQGGWTGIEAGFLIKEGGAATNDETEYSYPEDDGSQNRFRYSVNDPASTDSATVSVMVTGTNDAPTAHSDTLAVTEEGTVTVPDTDLLANDTDPDLGNPTQTVAVDTEFDDATGFTLVNAAAVTGGMLQVTDNVNSVTGAAWTTNRVDLQDGLIADFDFGFPEPGGTGADGLGFTIQTQANNLDVSQDGPGADSLTVVIDTYDNDTGDVPPRTFVRVLADGQNIAETNLFNIFPGQADLSGTTGNNAQISLAGGRLSVMINGETVIEPVSVDLASLGAVDGSGAAFVGFSASTGGANEEHNVQNFSLTTLQNGTPDTLSVQSVSSTSGATVTLNAGNVTYDPNGAFNSLAIGETAVDTFTYTLSDASGGTDTGTVNVTITGENDSPIAVDDTATVGEEGPAVNLDPVANDSDPDTVVTFTQPQIELGQFDDSAAFNLVGTASYNSNKLQLTSNANSQKGSAWTNDRIHVAEGFTALINLGFPNILQPDGRGADGISFSVQNLGNDLDVGEGSAGAGALTISLDSYETAPNNSLLRVFADGANVAETDPGFDFSGTDNIDVLVEYTPGDLTISLNGTPIISNLNVDLNALGSVDANGDAFVGFGGRTGGAAEEHNINSFTLTSQSTTTADQLVVDGHRFDDFSQAIGLQLNGDALIDGTVLELAQNQNNQQGSAFLDTRQYVLDGFQSSFTFDLEDPNNSGADGMFFTVHNDTAGASFTGTQSGPNGNALTIEIDSYNNGAGAGDPSAANIKIRSNTSVGGIIATADLNAAPLNIADLSGSGEHTIEVSYDGAMLDVTFDGELIFDDLAVDLTSLGAVDANGEAFVGLGGRTGGANETSRILDWSFNSTVTETLPSGASITRNADGTVDYDPNGAFDYISAGDTDTDSFTYTIDDGNGGTDTATVVVTITGVNDPVTNVSAGGPYTVAEGGSFTLDGSFEDLDDNDTYTIEWTINGSVVTGATELDSVVTYSQLQAIGIDDGTTPVPTFDVELTVNDNAGSEESATSTDALSLTNAPPAASIQAMDQFGNPTSQIVPGYDVTFTVSADDPSNTDDMADFTYMIDFDGDGTFDQTATGPMSGVEFTTQYGSLGTRNVQATATDKDGGVSDIANFQLDVVPVAQIGNDIVAGGTDGMSDRIIFYPTNDGVQVRYNNDTYPSDNSSFTVTPAPDPNPTRLIAFGRGSSDQIIVAGRIDANAEFDGGDGNDYLTSTDANDTLVGGQGNDILLAGEGDNFIDGGDGTDRLEGRSGDDVIFGGAGSDRLNGNAGDDILDGGADNDFLFGGLGDDLLVGRVGADTLNGHYGNDVILGGASADQIFGSADNDLLIGGAAADRVRGDSGNDDLIGGTSALDDDIESALDAMMASLGTSMATADANVDQQINEWFDTGSDRAGFEPFTDDGAVDDLTGDGGNDEFHTSGDSIRDFRSDDSMFS